MKCGSVPKENGRCGLELSQEEVESDPVILLSPSKCFMCSNREVLASHPTSFAFLEAQTVHLLPACYLGRVKFHLLSSWSFLPEQFLVLVELSFYSPKKSRISGLLLLALFFSWLLVLLHLWWLLWVRFWSCRVSIHIVHVVPRTRPCVFCSSVWAPRREELQYCLLDLASNLYVINASELENPVSNKSNKGHTK